MAPRTASTSAVDPSTNSAASADIRSVAPAAKVVKTVLRAQYGAAAPVTP